MLFRSYILKAGEKEQRLVTGTHESTRQSNTESTGTRDCKSINTNYKWQVTGHLRKKKKAFERGVEPVLEYNLKMYRIVRQPIETSPAW